MPKITSINVHDLEEDDERRSCKISKPYEGISQKSSDIDSSHFNKYIKVSDHQGSVASNSVRNEEPIKIVSQTRPSSLHEDYNQGEMKNSEMEDMSEDPEMTFSFDLEATAQKLLDEDGSGINNANPIIIKEEPMDVEHHFSLKQSMQNDQPIKQENELIMEADNIDYEDMEANLYHSANEESQDFNQILKSKEFDEQPNENPRKKFKSSDSLLNYSNNFGMKTTSRQVACKSTSSVQKNINANEMKIPSHAAADDRRLLNIKVDVSLASPELMKNESVFTSTDSVPDDIFGIKMKDEKMDNEEFGIETRTIEETNLSTSGQMPLNKTIKVELDDYFAAGSSGLNDSIIFKKVVIIPASTRANMKEIIVIKRPLPPDIPTPSSSQQNFRRVVINNAIPPSSETDSMHESQQEFVCKLCGNKYSVQCRYKHHMTLHEAKKEKYLECKLCDKKFLKKERYDEHMEMQLPKDIYPCEIREKKFTTHAAAMEHIKIAHSKQLLMKCGLCNYETRNRGVYKKHVKMHLRNVEKLHKTKFYKCDQCPQSFREPSALKMHKDLMHPPK